MAKYEELQQQLFAEFLRLCDLIDQCARILLQNSPEPVLQGVGGTAEQQTEDYVRQVSIDAAKKKDAVWDVYSLMGKLHGRADGIDGAIGQLERADQGVDDVLDQFDLATGFLADWEGKAATALKVKLSELKTFAKNQVACVALLKETLTQYGLLVQSGEANAENAATALTGALTEAADLRATTQREFPVKMFDDGLGIFEAGKSKDPIAVYKSLKTIIGDIRERNEILAATEPDKIIAEFEPKVSELRENLAAAGNRLATQLNGVITDITAENGKTFFSDAKLNIDVLSPGFKSAEFRLKDAADWDDFAKIVDKLPKTLPKDAAAPGPIAQGLEAS
jgi:hypothetical protein